MARTSKSVTDPSLLQAALEGLQAQKSRITEQIAQVEQLLGHRRGKTAMESTSGPAAAAPRKRKKLSAAARKRISIAQRKRWADYRKISG